MRCANCMEVVEVIAINEAGDKTFWCSNCGTIEQFKCGQTKGTRGTVSIPKMTDSDGK